MFSIWTLVGVVAMAVVSDVLEFIAGAAGARKGGAGFWSSAGALVGGILGALAGTALIPIPLLGTLVGACVGAGATAWGLEMSGGKEMSPAVMAGVGAGVGTLMGTLIKLTIGLGIWLVIAVAAFWP